MLGIPPMWNVDILFVVDDHWRLDSWPERTAFGLERVGLFAISSWRRF